MITNQKKSITRWKIIWQWSILFAVIGGGISYWVIHRPHDDEWEKYSRQTVEHFYGRKLILPMQDSVQNLSTIELKNILTNSRLKIVTYVDVDCSICMLKLDFWRKFIQNLTKKGARISILIYAHSTRKENLIPLMENIWPQDQPWIYDQYKNFIITNELYDDHFQSLLLNQKNEIILIGDPTLNKGMEKLFMKSILSYSE
ncbi:MAG: hypothetical protein J1F42_12425 [Lachnospiraceae bacterium]|nr:hypothetical protein [Lachnospiraceae bacterium]